MQTHIQELIEQLNNQGFDWTDNELLVTPNKVIVVNRKSDDVIERYTIVKNKDNTFTCYFDFNGDEVASTTRNAIEQIVDYVME